MITGITIYLSLGLIWIIILEAAVYTLPEDDLDTQAIIFNLLLWPMVIVYLYREWIKRE